jgi:hypothetical protein
MKRSELKKLILECKKELAEESTIDERDDRLVARREKLHNMLDNIESYNVFSKDQISNMINYIEDKTDFRALDSFEGILYELDGCLNDLKKFRKVI